VALKGNHPKLLEDVTWLFEQQGEPHYRQETPGHGRVETREAWLLNDLDVLGPVERASWRDLRAVVRLRSTRELNGSVSMQDRYLLISHQDVEKAAYAVRAHWVSRMPCTGCLMLFSPRIRVGLVRVAFRPIW
jgi:hypothetical protein